MQARELGVSVTNETLRDAVVGLLEDREKDGHVEEDAEDFGKALWHVYRGAVEAGALPDQTTGQLILDAMIKENKLGLALKLAAEFRMNAIDLSVNADKMMEDACNMGMTLVASEAESLLVGTQTTGNVISRCKLALLLGDSAKALGLLKQIEHDGELEQALDALKLWPSLLFTNSAVPRGLLKPSMLKGHMEALVHGGIQLDLEAAFEGIESLDTAVEPEK